MEKDEMSRMLGETGHANKNFSRKMSWKRPYYIDPGEIRCENVTRNLNNGRIFV
jgi:hypothetical protein